MPINLEVLRELTPEDLTAKKVPATVVRRDLDQVRAIHHAQARMLAQGLKVGMVAASLGTSRATLESLLQDPTFQDLVSYYRDQLDVVYISMHDKAALVARMALGELQERLEVTPSKFSDNQLRELAIAMMDRTELPPKASANQATTAPVITFNFGGIAERKSEAPQVTIEATAEPTEP